MVSSEAAMATLRSNMWRPTAVSYQSIGWFCGTTTPTTSWRLGWKLPFQQVELQRDEIEKDRLGGVNCKYIIYCIKTHMIFNMLLYVLIWCAHTHRYIYIYSRRRWHGTLRPIYLRFLACDMGFMYQFCYGSFNYESWGLCADLTGRYFSICWQMTWDYLIKFDKNLGTPGKHRRPRWEVAGNEMGRRILPQEMGRPRWEVAVNE